VLQTITAFFILVTDVVQNANIIATKSQSHQEEQPFLLMALTK
jgi:hypothetical protein